MKTRLSAIVLFVLLVMVSCSKTETVELLDTEELGQTNFEAIKYSISIPNEMTIEEAETWIQNMTINELIGLDDGRGLEEGSRGCHWNGPHPWTDYDCSCSPRSRKYQYETWYYICNGQVQYADVYQISNNCINITC